MNTLWGQATYNAWTAQMAKLVDAPASGAGDRKVVEVRVLFWAPNTDLMSLPFKALIIETFVINLV